MVDTKNQPWCQESKLARIAFGIIEELLADQFCLFLIKCHYITIIKKRLEYTLWKSTVKCSSLEKNP